MGEILNQLKGIPINPIVKSRLVELEKELVLLREENAALKSENVMLYEKTEVLEATIQKIKREQESQEANGDICPYCHKNTGQLIRRVPHPTFGPLGIYMHYYICQACGKEYEKEHKP